MVATTAVATVAMPLTVILAIALIGTFEIVVSTLLQRKLINTKKSRQIQYRMNMISKEVKEMIKNKESTDAINQKNKEMMPLASESMKMTLKPMIAIFPLFIFVYYVVIGMYLSDWKKYVVNFIIPMHYKTFFIVFILIVGMVIGIAISIYDRKKAKEEMSNTEGTSNTKEIPKPVEKGV